MLGNQAVAEVQQICGWRSDKADQILLALQYAQSEREKPGITFPWWLKIFALIPTVVGQALYSVPDNFIQEQEPPDGDLIWNTGGVNARNIFLPKMDVRTAEQAFYGAPQYDSGGHLLASGRAITGAPRAFALDTLSLRIYPTPDAVYSIFWNFWAKDDVIALTAENKWLKNAPWVLIGDAAKKIGSDLGNSNAVSTASAILAQAEANMFRSVIHRAEAGTSRLMGSRL